jgi:hypothetical protein
MSCLSGSPRKTRESVLRPDAMFSKGYAARQLPVNKGWKAAGELVVDE